jgi:hypothetical protein
MGVNITEGRQTYIQSNVEQEAKPVVVVVWRGGEAIRQNGRFGGRAVRPTFIGKPSEDGEGRRVLRL